MARTRRRFDSGFKAKVALEAVRGLKTISEIAQQFKVHPNQVTLWKKQLLAGAEQVFEGGNGKSSKSEERRARGLGVVRADRPAEGRAGVAQKKSCRELVRSP